MLFRSEHHTVAAIDIQNVGISVISDTGESFVLIARGGDALLMRADTSCDHDFEGGGISSDQSALQSTCTRCGARVTLNRRGAPANA